MQVQDLPKEYKNLLRSIGVSKSDWKDPTKREVIVNTFNDKLNPKRELPLKLRTLTFSVKFESLRIPSRDECELLLFESCIHIRKRCLINPTGRRFRRLFSPF